MAALTAIANAPLAVGHVLAQEPGFDPVSHGFADQEEYEWSLHRLGNLTLLEEAINSRARNKAPEMKGSDAKLYKTSDLRTVRDLGIQIQQKPGLWSKSDIEARTTVLTECALRR